VLRDILLAGTVTFVPLAATVVVMYLTIRWLDEVLAPFFVEVTGVYFPGSSLVALFLIIFALGLLSRVTVGRVVIEEIERAMLRVPLVRTIYGATKEAVKVLVGGEAERIRGVVLVEYPRKGVYALGFTSGKSVNDACAKTGKKLVNVFIPTSPNPTSGLVVLVPEDEVIYLDISVEDAMRIIISGGFSE